MLTETLLQEATAPGQRGRVFSARDFLMRLVFLLKQPRKVPIRFDSRGNEKPFALSLHYGALRFSFSDLARL